MQDSWGALPVARLYLVHFGGALDDAHAARTYLLADGAAFGFPGFGNFGRVLDAELFAAGKQESAERAEEHEAEEIMHGSVSGKVLCLRQFTAKDQDY